MLEQVRRIIPCSPILLWLLKLYTWLKNSGGLENVNYTNPCCDCTDSCWSSVDCQGGTFSIKYWRCSVSTSRHFIPHYVFLFGSLGPDVSICVEVESWNDLDKEPSYIPVIEGECLLVSTLKFQFGPSKVNKLQHAIIWLIKKPPQVSHMSNKLKWRHNCFLYPKLTFIGVHKLFFFIFFWCILFDDTQNKIYFCSCLLFLKRRQTCYLGLRTVFNCTLSILFSIV